MNRRGDWEPRLASFVEKRREQPYTYGKNDCLLALADAVKAVTGKDYGRGHRGKYKSAASASRYLRKLGHDSPESYLDSLFTEKLPSFAQRGDIVLADDGIPALCMGGFALSVGSEGDREGLVRIPRERWVKAWAVGEHHSGECACPKRKAVQS
jgi:hypothetical protein